MDIAHIKAEAEFLSGSGNLFTVINNIKFNETVEFYATNTRHLCSYSAAKTMEGLIIINSDAQYDFSVWFFNPDGSNGMMCGNGGRCAIYYYVNYIASNYTNNQLLQFSMNGKVYSGRINGDAIYIYFKPPTQVPASKTISVYELLYNGLFVDVGSPHWVIDIAQLGINDINKVDVAKIGQAIRQHSEFAPAGTNVNFFQVINNNTIHLRTYERGVENETGACGTGSIATALVYYQQRPFSLPLNIIPTSQSPLTVELIFDNDTDKNLSALKHIILGGKVNILH